MQAPYYSAFHGFTDFRGCSPRIQQLVAVFCGDEFVEPDPNFNGCHSHLLTRSVIDRLYGAGKDDRGRHHPLVTASGRTVHMDRKTEQNSLPRGRFHGFSLDNWLARLASTLCAYFHPVFKHVSDLYSRSLLQAPLRGPLSPLPLNLGHVN